MSYVMMSYVMMSYVMLWVEKTSPKQLEVGHLFSVEQEKLLHVHLLRKNLAANQMQKLPT